MFAAAQPVLQDIAPAIEKRASRSVTEVQGSHDTLRGDVVDLHSEDQAHAKRLGDISSMLVL